MNVLIVEDNPGDARLMEEMLREQGVSLERSERLESAIDRVLRGGIDVVLLDLGLPDSMGLETFRVIHALAPFQPIIVLTGHDDAAAATASVEEGAQDYLVKGEIGAPLLRRAVRYAIERHRQQRRIESLSLTDELTGLYNRRGFLRLAEQQMRAAVRRGCDTQLAFLDLDRLKQINDTHGHAAGDEALRAAADVIRHTFRSSDVLGRVGGDEFAALLVDAARDAETCVRARLAQALAGAPLLAGGRLGLSLGMSSAPSDTPLDTMLAMADAKMYADKARRRAAGGHAA